MRLRFRRAATRLRRRLSSRLTRGRRIVRKRAVQPTARVRARVKPVGRAALPTGYQKAGATARATGSGRFKVVWSPKATLSQRIAIIGEVMGKTKAKVAGSRLSKSTVSVPVTMLGRARSMFGLSPHVIRTE